MSLAVIHEVAARDSKRRFACLCVCGKTVEVFKYNLDAGQQSCGCLRKTNKTHGMSSTKTFKIWSGMLQRCLNPKASAFENYGGRGVTVCDRWRHSFVNFFADMGECPDGFSIERIDCNGGYSPSNCKWISLSEQSKNRRTSHKILHDGEMRLVSDVAAATGIKHATVLYRAQHGVSINKRVGRDVMIEHGGCVMNIKQWASILGLAKSTISTRIKRGLSTEMVLHV